jgi:hypothetical protein
MNQALFDLLKPYLAGQLRHALTVLAGALITKGALASSDANAFVTIASGLVVWGIGAGWSLLQKRGQAQSLRIAQMAYQAASARVGHLEKQVVALKQPPAASVTKS